MDNYLQNTYNGICPAQQPQYISNEQFPSLPDSNTATFGLHTTAIPETVSEQTNQNRDNLPNNICKLLEDRKVENTTVQTNNVKTIKIIEKISILLFVAIVALIITSIVVSPYCAIGIALPVILTVILTVINKLKLDIIGNLGLQNMSIDILLNATKDNIPTHNISAEENTKLLNILANAVNSACTKELIININSYNAVPIDLFETESRKEMTKFINKVFDNDDLTTQLHSLEFNTDNVKENALNYIDNLSIKQITKVILGKQCKF